MNPDVNDVRDLDAIQRLHQQDIQASKSGDFATLRSLIADDAVMLPPDANWVSGKQDLDDCFHRMSSLKNQSKTLEYFLEFEEIEILGNYAFEWGRIRSIMRSQSQGKLQYLTYKVMRILKKQPNGEWKIYRSIWNDDPSE